MAVYDLEEQDQLEDLKAWWTQWGGIISGVVIALCAGVIVVQGWRWWSQQQAEKGSVLYNAVSAAARANDVAKAKDAMAQLADKYGGTAYAPRAALILAATLNDAGDQAGAKAQLASVIDRDSEDELKQIARLRLAAMLFDDKQYDDALRTLDAKHDDAFAAIYADTRGDILVAAGRSVEARAAYQSALTRLDPRSPYRNFVQVKLDTLGGAIPPAQGAATPAQGAVTPAQGAVTPAQGAVTPAQGAVTPAEGAVTPAQGAATPVAPGAAPAPAK
jgi:predicted negative regulator of RcsB-dependent stress response